MIYFLVLGALMLFSQIMVLYTFIAALGFPSHLRVSFYYLNAL